MTPPNYRPSNPKVCWNCRYYNHNFSCKGHYSECLHPDHTEDIDEDFVCDDFELDTR